MKGKDVDRNDTCYRYRYRNRRITKEKHNTRRKTTIVFNRLSTICTYTEKQLPR